MVNMLCDISIFTFILLSLPQIKADVIVTILNADGDETASKYCQEIPAQAAVPCAPTSTPTSTPTSSPTSMPTSAPARPGFHITPTGTGYPTYVSGVFENKLFVVQDGYDYVNGQNIARNGNVYAIDLTTVQRAWEVDLDSSLRTRMLSRGSYHTGLFYATGWASPGSSSYVYALNPETGAVVWTYDLSTKGYSNFGGTNHGVRIVDGKVITATQPYGNVYAMDQTTGAEAWVHPPISTAWGEGICALPAVGNGKVVYTDDIGRLFAVDIATGADVWIYDFPCSMSRSGPALHNGVVYAADMCSNPTKSHVSAVDAETGDEIWQITLTGAEIYKADIIYSDGMLFCGSYTGGAVYALDASDGTITWTFSTNGVAVQTDMVLEEGVLYLGVNKKIYAVYTATGEKKWEFALEGNPSSLTLNGGNLYFGTYDGHIYSLNKATGLLSPAD